ncbi:hypothetical protein [uncultured Methylobacterium sp.]|uniref:hypothetical protein n=1 Tax=uncultured Methylobacterium sp. TaxID=157278 RepID=UPI0035CB49D5
MNERTTRADPTTWCRRTAFRPRARQAARLSTRLPEYGRLCTALCALRQDHAASSPTAASVCVGRLPPARSSADGIVCAMKKNFPARGTGPGQAVPHVSRVEAMRLLLVVGTGLLALTACVGNEKNNFDPVSARLTQIQPKLSSTDDVALPGQATRQATSRVNTGVDPLSILYARQNRTSVANIQNDKRSSELGLSSPSSTDVSAVPIALQAERAVRPANLAPTLMSSGLPVVRQAPPRKSEDASTLSEVETRAEKEAVAQQRRDKRFDAQVRRVTASICSGCTLNQARQNIGN